LAVTWTPAGFYVYPFMHALASHASLFEPPSNLGFYAVRRHLGEWKKGPSGATWKFGIAVEFALKLTIQAIN
jgi:hypothetical protein